MKDEIKSLDDYKALVREYNESDSVSRREAIEDAIYDKASILLDELIALYAKYGRNFVEDSDFQEDRGCLSLSEFYEDMVLMHYSDRWSYGGECDIGITVQMKYLDADAMKALEKELREKRMERVKKLIQEKRDAIERLKKEVEELERTI